MIEFTAHSYFSQVIYTPLGRETYKTIKTKFYFISECAVTKGGTRVKFLVNVKSCNMSRWGDK